MKRIWIVAGVIAIAAVVALPFLLPERSVTLNDDAPEGDLQVQRSGSWKDGDSRHDASGAIALVTIDGTPHLQFTDFEMTAGPDVYLYLTESSTPRTTAEVEGGLRILVKTDADPSGRLNERGDFFVALDASLDDLARYAAVAAWCDDFNVLFGSAALS